MDKKIRKVDPHTFWFWLTNEVEVGKRKGVLNAPIPLPNVRAWMECPEPHGSEIIITVHDEQKDENGMFRRCGEISFRFTRIDNEQFEIETLKGGQQYISGYYDDNLAKKINDKWPEQPEHAQSKKRGQSSRIKSDIEARRSRVHYHRAKGASISDLAAREYVSQETIERDLGLRR
jgi:hypothetical protein